MKKILSFFVAGVLALGLIGCNGDLHDQEYNPISLDGYVISGGWGGWNGNLKEGLSGTSAVIDNLKPSGDVLVFCPNNGANYIKSLSEGTLPEEMSIGSMDDGYGGKNPTITGFKEGNTYKISLDTSKGVAEVSVEITDSPAPEPVAVPQPEKLIVLCGSFKDVDISVTWQGNIGTAVIAKGTDLTGWGSGKLECAIAENSSWGGKFCGATLNMPGEKQPLIANSGDNIVISEFAGKNVAEKTITLTFTITPEGTWQGDKNAYTETTIIEVSYNLSE